MRIALVYALNAKIAGGAGTYTVHLKVGLEKLGHTVDIWALGNCKNIPPELIKGFLKNSRGKNNFYLLQDYDAVHMTIMSEMGYKRECKENKLSKLHDLNKYVKYFITIHDLKNDFKRRLDSSHMINNSQAILCTSKTNQEEIKKMFDKECFVCRIPFSKEFPENIPVEERKKIVCISRFYPGKRTDEFFKMAKYLPEYDFVFRGAVYDKNRKPIGGLGAQIYFKKIEEITKEVNNVIFANDELSLEEVLKGALFSVDLSEQLDKDRPQYTTLEAFGAGVIPIINPSFSGRMRDGKEVLTAVSAEEAVEKIKNVKNHKEMLEFGKVYLEEYTKDTFNNFLDAYKNG